MRRSYEKEIEDLKNQKNTVSEQNEQYSRCFDNLASISKVLGEMIDLSDEKIVKQFIDKILISVVPQNGKFHWNYRLSETYDSELTFSVLGNKKRPNIAIETTSTEEGSEDAPSSDIHNDVSDLGVTDSKTQKNNPLKSELHRLLSQIRSKFDSLELMCKFNITLDNAKAFRAKNGQTIKSKIW